MQNLITKKIKEPVLINTQRLTITQIKESDKDVYYNLYTNKDLNALWGYDYTKDLGNNPTPDDFFNLQNKLKESEGEYAFAVRLNGEMIGELVLYNPTEISVEIGFRFFREYHGKGYAVESANALIEYAVKTLGAKVIKGRCFKQNVQSKALFLRLGFSQTSENDTHYFFELK